MSIAAFAAANALIEDPFDWYIVISGRPQAGERSSLLCCNASLSAPNLSPLADSLTTMLVVDNTIYAFSMLAFGLKMSLGYEIQEGRQLYDESDSLI